MEIGFKYFVYTLAIILNILWSLMRVNVTFTVTSQLNFRLTQLVFNASKWLCSLIFLNF